MSVHEMLENATTRKMWDLEVFCCVGLSGQMQPGDAIEFMNAACQGNMNVIDKYLEDGGNPNVHDEVLTPPPTFNRDK